MSGSWAKALAATLVVVAMLPPATEAQEVRAPACEYIYKRFLADATLNACSDRIRSGVEGAQLVQALTYRGIAYRWKRDFALAEADFREALTIDPNHAEAVNGLGALLFHAGNRSAALLRYNEALELDPSLYKALHNRGMIYAGKGDFERAHADHDEAIRLAPAFPVGYLARAYIWRMQRDYARARLDIDEAIRLDREYSLAYVIRASVHANLGDVAAAFDDIRQAILLDPGDSESFLVRGDLFEGRKEYGHAFEDYRQAVMLNPKSARAVFRRGLIYERFRADTENAVADYKTAVRLDPGYPDPHAALGRVYSGRKDYDSAIGAYSAAIDKTRRYQVNLFLGRGRAYEQKGDMDNALLDFKRAVISDPQSAEAYYERGRGFAELKRDYQFAIADFRAALEFDPARADVHAALGAAYRDTRAYADAIAAYSQAIKLKPDNPDHYQGRAKAYLAKGDKQRANADFAEEKKLRSR